MVQCLDAMSSRPSTLKVLLFALGQFAALSFGFTFSYHIFHTHTHTFVSFLSTTIISHFTHTHTRINRHHRQAHTVPRNAAVVEGFGHTAAAVCPTSRTGAVCGSRDCKAQLLMRFLIVLLLRVHLFNWARKDSSSNVNESMLHVQGNFFMVLSFPRLNQCTVKVVLMDDSFGFMRFCLCSGQISDSFKL